MKQTIGGKIICFVFVKTGGESRAKDFNFLRKKYLKNNTKTSVIISFALSGLENLIISSKPDKSKSFSNEEWIVGEQGKLQLKFLS